MAEGLTAADLERPCECGHVFGEHLTPGTECVAHATGEREWWCPCGRFKERKRGAETEPVRCGRDVPKAPRLNWSALRFCRSSP